MNTHRDMKCVQTIGVFEFTRVTCRPLLTFWVQAKLDIVNLFNSIHCGNPGMCATFESTTMTSVIIVSHNSTNKHYTK